MINIEIKDNAPINVTVGAATPTRIEEVEPHGPNFTTWNGLLDKPFSRVSDDFDVVEGSLRIVKTDNVEPDNTLPITSAGVHREVGNIEALLSII